MKCWFCDKEFEHIPVEDDEIDLILCPYCETPNISLEK